MTFPLEWPRSQAGRPAPDRSYGRRSGRRLVPVEEFGSNPGRLGMWLHVPDAADAPMPLVVVLHGCGQTAHAYDRGSGWSDLADEHGFAVLFAEQQRRNNPHLCFDWYLRNHSGRDRGQPASVREMIETAAARHAIDPTRIFVTGLSAGGAMAVNLLAAYPDVFAGGAVIAGLPYRAATTLRGAVDAMARGTGRTDADLAEAVAAASGHGGPWPRLTVWHGTADDTVSIANAEELVAQWRSLSGLGSEPSVERHGLDGSYRAWNGPDGRPHLEARLLIGLGHGTPIDLAAHTAESPGGPGPFFLDAGVSSTREIAAFWGIATASPARAAPHRPAHPLGDLAAIGAWIGRHVQDLIHRVTRG